MFPGLEFLEIEFKYKFFIFCRELFLVDDTYSSLEYKEDLSLGE